MSRGGGESGHEAEGRQRKQTTGGWTGTWDYDKREREVRIGCRLRIQKGSTATTHRRNKATDFRFDTECGSERSVLDASLLHRRQFYKQGDCAEWGTREGHRAEMCQWS